MAQVAMAEAAAGQAIGKAIANFTGNAIANLTNLTSLMSFREQDDAVYNMHAKDLLGELHRGRLIDTNLVKLLMEESPPVMSAETAADNGMLLTVEDVAALNGGIKGEDMETGDKEALQGDMLAGDDEQLSLAQATAGSARRWVPAGRPWPLGVVKYCFASDISAHARHIFNAAVAQYMLAVPCLTFVDVGWLSGSGASATYQQKCMQSPAIFVTSVPGDGCNSYVGVLPNGASQRLNLQDPGCISLGTALHEIGHALGLAHEQARTDRDQYVTIKWGNVKETAVADFTTLSNTFSEVAYDYLSVMHYGAAAYSKDNVSETIQVKVPFPHGRLLGQRTGLSKHDVTQVVAMYKPEVSSCQGSALAGQGCVDALDDNGVKICEGIEVCSAAANEKCCACGGGFEVQCYQGLPCPRPPTLPRSPAAECLVAKTRLVDSWAQTYGCVVRNVCDFDVSFQCPEHPCTHTTSAGLLQAFSCNGQKQTRVCDPGACAVFNR